MKTAGLLIRRCTPDMMDILEASDNPAGAKLAQHTTVLLGLNQFGQLMLVMLAVQTQLLLQEHFPVPAQGSLDGSSSSSSSAVAQAAAAAAAVPAAQYHLQLWQDLCLPRALLDQAAVAARKLTPAGGTARTSFLAAVQAVGVSCTLFELLGATGQPLTAADLSPRQLQLAFMGMRVPLLLMDVAQQAVNSLSSSSSSSKACTGGLDMDFVRSVLKAVRTPLRCWRLLRTASNSRIAGSSNAAGSSNNASSSRTAGSSLTAAGSTVHNNAAAATAGLNSAPSAQLHECCEIFLKQMVQVASSMLATPLSAQELTGAAASGSAQQACNALGIAGNSTSRSGGVPGQKTGPAAAVFSAWSKRLHVVRTLVRLLNIAAQQQQQQQQPPQPLLLLALGRTAAEVVQLLQQHLRTVLLPLLASPAAEVSAIGAGSAAWLEFCEVLVDLCMVDEGPSTIVWWLLPSTAARTATASSLEQPLFGLLLSFCKAVVHASQLPAVASISPEVPAPYSMLRMDAWQGCCRGLSGLVYAVGINDVDELAQQQQQQQRGVFGSNTAVPWLQLLVRTLFAGSKLAAGIAVACAAEEEAEARAVDKLRWCLVMLENAADYFWVATDDSAAAAAAATAGDGEVLQQLRQQLEQQLSLALHTVLPLIQAPGVDSGSSSNSRSISAVVGGFVEEVAKQLQQWCLTFCGHFATSCCCNNPGCTNLARSSEQELVGGKQCVCSRCVTARYCSKECQEVMWPYHKQICKVLKQQRRQQQDVQQQDVQQQDVQQQQQQQDQAD
jgi:hypothetical protein